MRGLAAALAALLALAAPAFATPPLSAEAPARRPAAVDPAPKAAEPVLRPRPRPSRPEEAEVAPAHRPAQRVAEAPPRRPARIPAPAADLPAQPAPPLPAMNVALRTPPRALPPDGGLVCDDPRLEGTRVARIAASNPGCGIAEPVRITTVAGVRLTRAITTNCALATSFADWVQSAALPLAEKAGEDIVAINVFDSYSCRGRNNQRGARLSEHARGNAIDIADFLLAGGREVSVLRDWKRGDKADLLAGLHRSACGTFNTVLGPAADRFHRNHFHFDVGNPTRNPYCR